MGSGIAMIVVGAILYWAVDVNLPFIFDGALGVILMIAGVISVVATIAMQVSGSPTRRVVERRYWASDPCVALHPPVCYLRTLRE